jgi:hypothetical protein
LFFSPHVCLCLPWIYEILYAPFRQTTLLAENHTTFWMRFGYGGFVRLLKGALFNVRFGGGFALNGEIWFARLKIRQQSIDPLGVTKYSLCSIQFGIRLHEHISRCWRNNPSIFGLGSNWLLFNLQFLGNLRFTWRFNFNETLA